MVASPKITHQHTIYAVSDTPRELTPADLAFVCQYTGRSSDTALPHVLEVWRDTKKQVRAVRKEYACNDDRRASWYESHDSQHATGSRTMLGACSSGSSNAYRSSCFLHLKSQLIGTTRLCKQRNEANTAQNCCIWYRYLRRLFQAVTALHASVHPVPASASAGYWLLLWTGHTTAHCGWLERQ